MHICTIGSGVESGIVKRHMYHVTVEPLKKGLLSYSLESITGILGTIILYSPLLEIPLAVVPLAIDIIPMACTYSVHVRRSLYMPNRGQFQVIHANN